MFFKPSVSAALGIGILLASACQGRPPESAQGGGPPATPVKIAAVRQIDIEESSAYVANLAARQAASIRPQVSGQITQANVQLGDRAGAGSVLFQIDSAEQRAAVQSRDASIASARATVEQARMGAASAQAELLNRQAAIGAAQANQRQAEVESNRAQADYDRLNQLFQEGALSRQQLDTAKAALDTAVARVDVARQVVQQAQASLKVQQEVIRSQQAGISRAEQDLERSQADAQQDQVVLQRYQVVAPFTGTVGEVAAKVGDYVTPQSVLTTLSQSETLELSINIPLERAPDLRLGTPVQILGPQGQPLATTQISFIGPQASLTSQSILARANLSNAQGQFRPDQFVRTRIVWGKQPRLVVPLTAISRVAGQNFVFVATSRPGPDGKPSLVAIQKPVQIGPLQGNDYPVLSGLQANEPVVVSGLQKIFDQAPILDESKLPPPGSQPRG